MTKEALEQTQHRLSEQNTRTDPVLALGLMMFLIIVGDRLWLAIDRRPPAWDQADYLNWVLEYQRILETSQPFSGEWWHQFWLLSPKIPPLMYVTTVPFVQIFGASPDSSTLVMLLYSAILLGSVYGLGRILFNGYLGLWAALLCILLPGLYRYRLDFLQDYPLTAMVTWSFFCLTLWWFSRYSSRSQQWGMAALMGVSVGLALLTKQTALFFLLTPIAVSGITSLYQRQWERLGQWLLGGIVALGMLYPWVRTNWLLILTSGKRATIDSAIAEGDPPLYTLDAWLYYWKDLPELVSWPLLWIPIVGFIGIGIQFWRSEQRLNLKQHPKTIWILLFLVGSYFLCSLNINKDTRYILPSLPVLSLLLAYGLNQWDKLSRKWGPKIRWGTIGLAGLLMFLNLYPLGGQFFIRALSPGAMNYPVLGLPLPHPKVIDEIIKTEPYLRSNVGVLPSTPTLNQHNINYYGQVRNSQVHGRQVGTNSQHIVQDGRSLRWFITKTGQQGLSPSTERQQLTQFIETGGLFNLHQSWSLNDGSQLNLYHQHTPPVQVVPLDRPLSEVQLYNLFVASPVPPGSPVPVTYQWHGPWKDLQSGLVLITWIRERDGQIAWIHDHGFGMGNLYAPDNLDPEQAVEVSELTSMLPPADMEPGSYVLKVQYLPDRNWETRAQDIPIPPIRMMLSLEAPAQPALELDLSTQFRTFAATLSQGPTALEHIFSEVGRINQYDPTQDYLLQVDRTLSYRLQQDPNQVDSLYSLVLSRVLRQDVPGAIAALDVLTTLEPNSPYPWAYLAVVYLYDWKPQKAQNVLETALQLKPDEPEIRAMQAISWAMQGRFFKAWQLAKTLDLI